MRSVYALILLTLIALASCSQESGQVAKANEPIKIGVITSLTGFGATWGTHLRQGAELAQKELNAKGGINGRPIELIFEDMGPVDPKKITTAAEKLVEIDQVDLLFTQWADDTEIAYPIAKRKDLVIINIASGSPKVPRLGPNVFMVAPSDEEYINRLIDYLEANNKTQGALIVQAGVYYNAIAEIFENAWIARGHAKESLDIHRYQFENDFRTMLLKITEKDPQFIWLDQDYDGQGSVKYQAKQLGVDVMWLAINQNDVPEFFTAARDASDGVVFTKYEKSSDSFQSLYQNAFNQEPQMPADYAYDTLYLLNKALSGKEVNSQNIREGLTIIKDYAGASGTISFDSEGQRSGKRSYLFITKDGKGVSIE